MADFPRDSDDRSVVVSGGFIVHEAREAVREFFRPITASIERVRQSGRLSQDRQEAAPSAGRSRR